MVRSGVAADLALDECRCVLVRLAQGATLEQLAADLFRASAAFSECLLILRAGAPGALPALLLQLPRVADTVCPGLSLRLLLSAGDDEAELAVVSALLGRSRERSALRRVGRDGWLRREWLEPSESSHEALLCAFPALAPLTAQLLLSQFPLLELFRTPQPVLAALGPLLPPHVLPDLFAFLKDAAGAASHRPYTNPKRGGEIQKHASKLTLNNPRPGRHQTTLSLTRK